MAYGFNENKTKANIEDIAAAEAAGKVDKVAGKGLSDNNYTNAEKAIVSGFTAQLAGKVDKVAGKALSTNDFTNSLKSRVDESSFNTFDGSSVTLAQNGTSYYNTFTCPHDGYIRMNAASNASSPSFNIAREYQEVITVKLPTPSVCPYSLTFVKKGTKISYVSTSANTSVIYYPLTSYT